jgi:hypothetical protein
MRSDKKEKIWHFFKSRDPDQRIYIRTYDDDFHPNHDYHSFIPVPHLVERYTSSTARSMILRLGSISAGPITRSQTNKLSPTEKIIHYIELEIRANPSVNFFPATDSHQEGQVILSRYGDRIKVRKKMYSRASLAGMEDALVDMYCLAATQRLYTS